MTAEDEKRLILLTAIIRLGGSESKAQVLDEVERTGIMKFSPHDLQYRRTRNELNWRNDLAYIRDHLINEGYLSSAKWNTWAITESGKKHFASLAAQLAAQRQFQHFNADAMPVVLAIASDNRLSDENAFLEKQSLPKGNRHSDGQRITSATGNYGLQRSKFTVLRAWLVGSTLRLSMVPSVRASLKYITPSPLAHLAGNLP